MLVLLKFLVCLIVILHLFISNIVSCIYHRSDCCLLHAMVSSRSSVASFEDDEEEVTVETSSQEKAQQQDVTQQQNVAAKAGPQRQRGKRARSSVDLSSSNPSVSASRKSVAWKDFKVISHFHQKLLM